MIGSSGVINANGFTASVLDISNKQFMQGGPLNFQGDSTASVINQGTIRTGSGGAALLGQQVINSGTISSDGGSITLAAGGSVTLDGGSRYIQADLATLENGISETASLINNSGTIRATGALKAGGEVYLVNPGGKVLQQGLIAAQKQAEQGELAGGSVKLEAAGDTARVEGTIDVSGSVGGRIEVLGQQVELAGATLQASGEQGGGVILAGGDFQGNNPAVLNALQTTVDADSLLAADALLQGDGGQVVLWADDSTEFFGSITAHGGPAGGNGGFVEVSGKQSLLFDGFASTLAPLGSTGALLLDPTNFTIRATGPPGSDANSIRDNTLVDFLGNNNVVIATGDSPDPAGGHITVASGANVQWSTAHSLTLLAHGNILVQGNIINTGGSAAGEGGNVNLVAGWDGVAQSPGATGANQNAAFDFGSLVVDDVFGETTYGGDIILSRSNGSVVVGSRFGATNVAAHNLTLQAGTTAAQQHAQLGYRPAAPPATRSADSPITVRLRGSLTASGGTGYFDYVQIGHGGDERSGSYAGAISVLAEGSINFQGGSGFRAYAQLGHGGTLATGNHQGMIEILSLGNVDFAGGSVLAYAQLGHGGASASGDHSGGITIHSDDVNFSGGDLVGYAQIGHGGDLAVGNHSGDIQILALGMNLQAGEQWAIAQVGHGGFLAEGQHEGDIRVGLLGDLNMIGQDVVDRYTVIGHGFDPLLTIPLSDDAIVGPLEVGFDQLELPQRSVAGDIAVAVGGSIEMSSSYIGHLAGQRSDFGEPGAYLSGNTFVALGTIHYNTTNTSDALVGDGTNQLFSAPDGELRLYMPLRSSFQLTAGDQLNGTDVGPFVGTVPLPNEQGAFFPFQGPYDIDLDAGNFAFYFADATIDDPTFALPPLDSFVYDQFVRYQDNWRTLRSLLGYGSDILIIRHGPPGDEEDEGVIAQQDSFDVFGG